MLSDIWSLESRWVPSLKFENTPPDGNKLIIKRVITKETHNLRVSWPSTGVSCPTKLFSCWSRDELVNCGWTWWSGSGMKDSGSICVADIIRPHSSITSTSVPLTETSFSWWLCPASLTEASSSSQPIFFRSLILLFLFVSSSWIRPWTSCSKRIRISSPRLLICISRSSVSPATSQSSISATGLYFIIITKFV